MARRDSDRSLPALIGIGTIYAMCIGVISVVAVGLATSIRDDAPATEINPAVVARASAEANKVAPLPTETPYLPPQKTPKPEQRITPKCYAATIMAGYLSCQKEVATRTKFVDRYTTNMPDIAKNHPAVDTPQSMAEGRTSLAFHGLEICALAADPHVSFAQMNDRFIGYYHNHSGNVNDVRSLMLQRVAINSICPENAAAWEKKAGL